MNWRELIPIFLIVFMLCFGLFYSTRMPENVAIHFDMKGNPDRWASKKIALWLMPLIALVAYVIMTILDLYFPKLFLFHWKLLMLLSLLNGHIAVVYHSMGIVTSIHYILAPMYILNTLYPLYIIYLMIKR